MCAEYISVDSTLQYRVLGIRKRNERERVREELTRETVRGGCVLLSGPRNSQSSRPSASPFRASALFPATSSRKQETPRGAASQFVGFFLGRFLIFSYLWQETPKAPLLILLGAVSRIRSPFLIALVVFFPFSILLDETLEPACE